MFNRGDAIVHPRRGAGVVVNIHERQWQGSNSRYYQIELLGREPTLQLMIPIEEADDVGLRPAIQCSEVEEVWEVLNCRANELPSSHEKRYNVLKQKLHAGDVFQVAEVLRDLTWRQKQQDHLTTRGERIYEEAILFLAGELAVTKGIEVAEAKAQIHERLHEILRA